MFPPLGERAWFLVRRKEGEIFALLRPTFIERSQPLSEVLLNDQNLSPLLETRSHQESLLKVKRLMDLSGEKIVLISASSKYTYIYTWDRKEVGYVAFNLLKEEHLNEFRIMALDKVTGDVQVYSVNYPTFSETKNWESAHDLRGFAFAVSEIEEPEFLCIESILSKKNPECSRALLYWFVKEGENWKKYKIDEGGCVP
jgi:hypothetical protein